MFNGVKSFGGTHGGELVFSLCFKLDRLTAGHIDRVRNWGKISNGSELLLPSKVSCMAGTLGSICDRFKVNVCRIIVAY